MGLRWTELSEEEKKEIKNDFQGTNPNMKDWIRFPDQKLMFPRSALKIVDELKNFPVKEDDIWIVTFPKCGTTWMQETISMLVNDVDETYGKMPMMVRSPFLDMDALLCGLDGELGGLMIKGLKANPNPAWSEEVKTRVDHIISGGNINMAKKISGRRVLKTHFPFDFLPENLLEKSKVVYVARTPMDCFASFFHFMVTMNGYAGGFSKLVDQFIAGFNLFGDYWTHLQSGWALKDHPNFKLIWFEDMKKDTKKVIQELTVFLDHPLSEDKIDKLVNHVSFDVMKNNPNANPSKNHLRKGEVGDGKSHFSDEEAERFQTWIQEKLKETGIELPA